MNNKNPIPVTSVFAVLLVVMYALNTMNPNGFYQLFVLKNGLNAFYPWQIVTYIFRDNTSILYYFFKVMIIFWFSSTLEHEWGSLHFGIFLTLAVVVKSSVALFVNLFVPGIPFEYLLNGYGSLISPNPLMLSLLTAFGFIYPDHKIYLFFVIPVRVKMVSIISLVIALVQAFSLFTSTPSLFAGFILAFIYLSGYTGIIVYHRRIFASGLSGFDIRRVVKRNVSSFNSRLNIKSEKSPVKSENVSLCEPEDFNADDQYCKTCGGFTKCKDREEGKL